MSENIYIIADLHLSAKRAEMVRLFFAFLDKIAHRGNTLYILGDFFDYWIGDDDGSAFNLGIIEKLKRVHNKGLSVFLMHGNRDFLIGKQFADQAKITLIDDPCVLEMPEKNILLMHGDLLCTGDKSYQYFRKFVRNRLVKQLYLALPLKLRQILAAKIRQKSRAKNARLKVIDVTQKGIKRYLNHDKILIHGHTHLKAIHRNPNVTRYVLGDWFKSGSYIQIDTKSNISLHDYDG